MVPVEQNLQLGNERVRSVLEAFGREFGRIDFFFGDRRGTAGDGQQRKQAKDRQQELSHLCLRRWDHAGELRNLKKAPGAGWLGALRERGRSTKLAAGIEQ